MASTFGEYEILDLLGRGGMGAVYRARHGLSGRIVALKMLAGDVAASESARERFAREAHAMARLRHRNIVAVHEVGEVRGVPFLAMAYLPGKTLTEIIQEAVPEERQAAAWMVKIADAIAHAHAHGLIHRDIKPGNVMIDDEGEPVVMDFGLVKESVADVGITAPDEVIGTPDYMSPEQVEGKPLDARSDLFSLGGLLYALLTGRPPFEGPVRAATMFLVTRKRPEPPSRIRRTVSADLETICLKALRKEPAARYQTAQAMRDDLRAFLAGDPITAKRESRASRAMRAIRRQRAVPVLTLTLGCLLGAAMILVIAHAGRPIDQDGRLGDARSQPAEPPEPPTTRAVADGDRLLGQCRFEEASEVYTAVEAEPGRLDVAKRLIALRLRAANALAAGGTLPVTFGDGTRATLLALDRSGVRVAYTAGNVGPRSWESMAAEDVLRVYRTCLSSPGAEDHLGLGALCRVLGLSEQAEREFEQASQLDPDTGAEADVIRSLHLSPAGP